MVRAKIEEKPEAHEWLEREMTEDNRVSELVEGLNSKVKT